MQYKMIIALFCFGASACLADTIIGIIDSSGSCITTDLAGNVTGTSCAGVFFDFEGGMRIAGNGGGPNLSVQLSAGFSISVQDPNPGSISVSHIDSSVIHELVVIGGGTGTGTFVPGIDNTGNAFSQPGPPQWGGVNSSVSFGLGCVGPSGGPPARWLPCTFTFGVPMMLDMSLLVDVEVTIPSFASYSAGGGAGLGSFINVLDSNGNQVQNATITALPEPCMLPLLGFVFAVAALWKSRVGRKREDRHLSSQ